MDFAVLLFRNCVLATSAPLRLSNVPWVSFFPVLGRSEFYCKQHQHHFYLRLGNSWRACVRLLLFIFGCLRIHIPHPPLFCLTGKYRWTWSASRVSYRGLPLAIRSTLYTLVWTCRNRNLELEVKKKSKGIYVWFLRVAQDSTEASVWFFFFKMNFIKDGNRVGTTTNKKANINIWNKTHAI